MYVSEFFYGDYREPKKLREKFEKCLLLAEKFITSGIRVIEWSLTFSIMRILFQKEIICGSQFLYLLLKLLHAGFEQHVFLLEHIHVSQGVGWGSPAGMGDTIPVSSHVTTAPHLGIFCPSAFHGWHVIPIITVIVILVSIIIRGPRIIIWPFHLIVVLGDMLEFAISASVAISGVHKVFAKWLGLGDGLIPNMRWQKARSLEFFFLLFTTMNKRQCCRLEQSFLFWKSWQKTIESCRSVEAALDSSFSGWVYLHFFPRVQTFLI